MGQSPRHVAYQGIGKTEHPVRDPGPVHNLRRQDEQGNGQQHKVSHPGKHVCCHGFHRHPFDLQVKKGQDDHGNGDGHAHQNQQENARKQGSKTMPLPKTQAPLHRRPLLLF